jgi:hypothetical protein
MCPITWSIIELNLWISFYIVGTNANMVHEMILTRVGHMNAEQQEEVLIKYKVDYKVNIEYP